VAILCAAADRAGLDMWAAWPCLAYVERHGVAHPEVALNALGALTRHASAEFAVRGLLEQHPALTLDRLGTWALSPDVHLRRLVSEGTRPRLPWGRHLAALRRDPLPVLPLLGWLRDDPEAYVRRSVANHLNDIARDHPELAIAVARRWLAEGGTHVRGVIRHGLRTLVKAGHPEALVLVGADPGAALEVEDLRVENDQVHLGGTLRFSFRLRNASDGPVCAVIDYVVHLRRARGALAPKVFKLSARTVPPRGSVLFRRAHPLRPVTTRRYYPGKHLLDIQVNGRMAARARFELFD
jgi:3-methyladenine DNA glycosylase AlkC